MIKTPVLAAILLAAIGTARAAPMLVNGDFEASAYTASSQFGSGYGGQGVTGWTANAGSYNLYFFGGTATTVAARTQYGSQEKLYGSAAFAGYSPTGGNFLALDGDPAFGSRVFQTVTGLTAGERYTVAFDWGAGQIQSRSGATTEQLVVGFGRATQATAVVANPSGSFTGWFHEAFTFTADGASDVLSFMSAGTPSGLPPIAVLDGVKIAVVPEPVSLGLVCAGIAALGVLRRRATR